MKYITYKFIIYYIFITWAQAYVTNWAQRRSKQWTSLWRCAAKTIIVRIIPNKIFRLCADIFRIDIIYIGVKFSVVKLPALDCSFFEELSHSQFHYLACSTVYSRKRPTTNPSRIPLYTWQPCTPPCSSCNGVEVECHKSHMAASNWSSTTAYLGLHSSS